MTATAIRRSLGLALAIGALGAAAGAQAASVPPPPPGAQIASDADGRQVAVWVVAGKQVYTSWAGQGGRWHEPSLVFTAAPDGYQWRGGHYWTDAVDVTLAANASGQASYEIHEVGTSQAGHRCERLRFGQLTTRGLVSPLDDDVPNECISWLDTGAHMRSQAFTIGSDGTTAFIGSWGDSTVSFVTHGVASWGNGAAPQLGWGGYGPASSDDRPPRDLKASVDASGTATVSWYQTQQPVGRSFGHVPNIPPAIYAVDLRVGQPAQGGQVNPTVGRRGVGDPDLEVAADGSQTVTYDGFAGDGHGGWIAGTVRQSRPGALTAWSAPVLVG